MDIDDRHSTSSLPDRYCQCPAPQKLVQLFFCRPGKLSKQKKTGSGELATLR